MSTTNNGRGAAAKRPTESWTFGPSITMVRVIVQVVVFALFATVVLFTTFTQLERYPNLRDCASKFLEVDPLIALATALSTHAVYRGLLWSLVVLVPTVFLGRFFCNWLCPYGTLHQFVGWLGSVHDWRRRGTTGGGQAAPLRSDENHPNRYRGGQRVKYAVLAALLIAGAFGSLQIGLLDPLCLLHRSLTGAAVPALALSAPEIFGPPHAFHGAWLIGLILFAFLALNLVYPRFFCRVLCPLGALLGVLSRWTWWRIDRDPAKCRGCDRCRDRCEGACDPQARLRTAECTVCLNCVRDCPEGALRFAFMPPRQREIAGPDVTRRKLIFGGLTGALFYPLARVTHAPPAREQARAIRPPGALVEPEFLERCIKCGQCFKACPTNVIQPAWFEAGPEGLWTPRLDFEVGHCQLHCTACGSVCPTGALHPLTIPEKLGIGQYEQRGPIRLGEAWIDAGLCIPHSRGEPCVVCEEVCPTSPKAIYTVRRKLRTREGSEIEVGLPYVDAGRCIGCGLCENQCPTAGGRRAIRVAAI